MSSVKMPYACQHHAVEMIERKPLQLGHCRRNKVRTLLAPGRLPNRSLLGRATPIHPKLVRIPDSSLIAGSAFHARWRMTYIVLEIIGSRDDTPPQSRCLAWWRDRRGWGAHRIFQLVFSTFFVHGIYLTYVPSTPPSIREDDGPIARSRPKTFVHLTPVLASIYSLCRALHPWTFESTRAYGI